MTLHAAKGLEFPVVAMIGLEEGCLPHARARGNLTELEEERRLCFVGITRAQEQLILTKAAYRTMRGLRERTVTSPFLTEMPQDALEVIDRTGLSFGDEPPRAARATRDGERAAWPARSARASSFATRRSAWGGSRKSPTWASTRAPWSTSTRRGRKTLILQYAKLEAVGWMQVACE